MEKQKQYGVKLSDLVEEYHLEIMIARPGLEFSGFFDYFDPQRLQVLGKVESTYLEEFAHEARTESF